MVNVESLKFTQMFYKVNGKASLIFAACQGYGQVVNVLLEAGANPDVQDYVCSCQWQ